jgi:polar amino acid transport system substrate-binding protein
MPGMLTTLRSAAMLCAALAATASSAASESLMEKIKVKGKVTVGTEAALPPFEFIQDGKIVGYGKDILDAIVADLGVQLEQLDLPFQGILPGVLAGKFDFVATSIGLRPERAGKYAFTMPIAFSVDMALKKAGNSKITAVEDLRGKVVGTQLASTGEADAKLFEAKLKADGGKGYGELKLYTSYPETYLALANGEIDIAIASDTLVRDIMKKRPGLYEVVGPVSARNFSCWVTRPEDKDFRDFLNAEFKKMRDNGTIYQLQEKWFGYKMELPDADYLPAGAI